jgi:tetratricopeptide (TPR) repeat protein
MRKKLFFPFLIFLNFGKGENFIRNGISNLAQKKYQKAIESFKQAKIKTPGIFYNLALSYWGKGDKGYAIYYLKKAIKLDPFYKRAKTALSKIENRKEEKPIINKKLSYFLFLALYLLLNLYIFFSVIKLIRFRKTLFFSILLLFILSIPLFLQNGFLIREKTAIIVEKGKVNLYVEPDDSSLIIYSLNEGEEITIISELGGWYQIKKGETYFGWIKGSDIKKL